MTQLLHTQLLANAVSLSAVQLCQMWCHTAAGVLHNTGKAASVQQHIQSAWVSKKARLFLRSTFYPAGNVSS